MKKNATLALISLLIMVCFPWLTVTFAKHDAGMAICFLLFFAINPIYAVIVGTFSGKDIKYTWFQPFLTSALFLAGTWLFFDEGETAFLWYAGLYTVLGFASMIIAAFTKKLSAK